MLTRKFFTAIANALALTFLCVPVALAQAHDAPSGRQQSAFVIRISIDRPSLKSSDYRDRGQFWVIAGAQNVSTKDQVITTWTQYGWSWLSDSREVVPGIQATKNGPTQITLKPRQVYRREVEAFTNPSRRQPITFRFGFVPNASRPVSGEPIPPTNVTWSNPVTLK